MKPLFNKKNLYCSISLIVHILVFLLMGIVFDFSAKIPVLGEKTQSTISAYVYHEQTLLKQTSPKKIVKNNHTVKNNVKRIQVAKQTKIALKKSKPVLQTENNQVQAQTKTSTQGEKTKELLALLHAAIQSQQHYPDSAMQMERQGRVRLAFILLTDGGIKNLRLIQSSGTNSLDQAALAAVTDALPFNNINEYLSQAQTFNIDVVFELS